MKMKKMTGLAACGVLVAGLVGAQDLPAAKDLIAKHIELIGGEEKIRSVESMSSKGTMEMAAMGMTADMEMYQAAPNKLYMKITIPNMGEITTGFNGEVAWSDNPMTGPMVLEGDQLKDIKKQADLYADLNYDKLYPTQETVEKIEFAGEDSYKVRLVDTDDKESFQYFSVASGLMIGNEGEQSSEMGTMNVVSEIREYKDYGGFKVPTVLVQKMMGMENTMTMTDVTMGGVDESLFELPESIKTLVGN